VFDKKKNKQARNITVVNEIVSSSSPIALSDIIFVDFYIFGEANNAHESEGDGFSSFFLYFILFMKAAAELLISLSLFYLMSKKIETLIFVGMCVTPASHYIFNRFRSFY
jgi:hypothetical protein